MRRTRVRAMLASGAVGVLVLAMTACSSGGSSEPSASPSPTGVSPSPSASGAATVAFDEKIQSELRQVGCYAGAIDGVIGPETDQAIVAFQEAVGLPVDGELGPDTDAALKAAVAEDKAVCTGTPSPTSSPTSSGASCTASSISQALESDAKLLSYRCVDVAAERWAAGQEKTGPAVTNFFLRSQDGAWVVIPNDEVCGAASAGLPKAILDYCGMT